MNLSLVIPCFNESDNIAQMFEQISAIRPVFDTYGEWEMILVDDGSSDNTFTRLQQTFADWPQVKIIQHPQNRGLGAALRTGFAHARGDIIVTTDSDGTYPFTTIPEMLALLRPGIDIVTASPYHPAGGVDGVPAYRLLFSKGASLMYRILLDRHLHTYTAMYRAYRRDVVEQIKTTSDGFLMVTELLVGALLAGYRVAEFPATLRVRRYGQSKARVWQITRSHLRFQAQVLWRRISTLGRATHHTRGTV